jgi:hypothetical protein
MRSKEMNLKQRLAVLVLPVAMLISGTSIADVVLPALDIQDLAGDAGASITGTSFSIDATAFTIVTTGDPIDISDEIFQLTSTSGSFVGGFGSFAGTFSAGGLLSGTFGNLTIIGLGGSDGQFMGDVTYTGGSLQGGLTSGSISGTYAGSSVIAKLGAVTVVPVPAAAWLFGSGLIGLVAVARRKV